jgi:bifunctional non-homologous end joining protein LigD
MVQWRTRPARNWRNPPGFIAPCLPILSDEIPVGPSWIHELKWDGYRIIAQRRESAVRLWSRNARNWASSFPRIPSAVLRSPVRNGS